ncbi:TolC family protein [Marinobacter sp. ANT_B65]|uniref:TolC family protein n=1 Tax=Marinobacter sp. ANT_B65 TaxID=2039467 RepID=UPI000BBE7AB4|nr:TolC family protein [Marinobacter sp. ANT_B65]PCM45882.1 hypothetical protein CPA50_07970 [Marinobacter sp. ANT_B65]
MLHIKGLAVVATLVVLAGCASLPDHSGKVDYTQQYLNGLTFSVDDAQTNNQLSRWWEALNDGQLNHLVDLAHTVNLDLQATDMRLQEALATLGVSESELLPQGGGIAEYSISERDGTRLESSVSGAQVRWELDLFGRIRSVIDAREAGVANAQARKRNVIKEVTVGVVQAYLRWESARQQVALIESDMRALEASLALINNRVDAGLSPRLDLARAETLYHQQRAMLPVAISDQYRTRTGLALLLGQDPERVILNAAPETLLKAQALPIGSNFAQAIQARSDISAALAELAQQAALSEAAVAELYPQVSVEGFGGVSNIESGGDGFAGVWSAVPRISWAVLSYPMLLKQVDVQSARTEAQYVAYRKTVVNAVGQARIAAEHFTQSARSESASEQALIASRTAFNTAKALYQEGAIGYIDYLDANREWIAAQRSHLEAQLDVADSRVSVLREFSGLWSHRLFSVVDVSAQ